MLAPSPELTTTTTTLEKWLRRKKYTQFYIQCCYCAIFVSLGALCLESFRCSCANVYICVRLNVFVVDMFFCCCCSVSRFSISHESQDRLDCSFSQPIFLVYTFSLCVGRSVALFSQHDVKHLEEVAQTIIALTM